jgi:hypothetical protein
VNQQKINEAIIYQHRVVDRLITLLKNVQALDKLILLRIPTEELAELGKLVTLVDEELEEIMQKHPSIGEEIRNKAKGAGYF